MKKDLFLIVPFILYGLPFSWSQNVGVGTLSPLSKLHIKGSSNVPQLIIDANSTQGNFFPLMKLRNSLGLDRMWIHSDTTFNTFVGLNTGRVNNAMGGGVYNTFNGSDAGYSNTTGNSNTANGMSALRSNSTGNFNTAIGKDAMYSNTTGYDNTTLGRGALYFNTTGYSNTASGNYALRNTTTGYYNSAHGSNALRNNTTGFNNTSNGYFALYSNTTGNWNTATGANALYTNTIGYHNIATGHLALNFNTSGNNNSATGNYSLYSNTTASNNTAHGYAALYANTTGASNTANGHSALYANTTGFNNTSIGYEALNTTTTGNNNTAIGFAADVSGVDISNATAIGSKAYAGASNSVVIGSINGVNGATANTNVGIGTSAPHSSAALEVKSTDKGILVPRIALIAANSASPVASPADALLVYNTATSGSGTNAVAPGFYYWKSIENKWRTLNQSEENAGYGTWGDCSMNNVSQYNPIAADDGITDDFLGSSVSISGDYAIAGASEDYSGSNFGQGAAYIYHFNGGQWIQTQKLVASDGGPSDYFGYSVALSGNYAIIGAFDDKIGVNEGQGSVYIFFYNGTQWIEQQKLTASDGAAFDAFGLSVGIDGDYAAIGAIRHDVGPNADQGCVYVFKYNGSTWLQQQKLLASDPAANQALGTSVSIKSNRIISGTNGATVNGNAGQGSAYVFSYNGSTWSQQQKLTASDGGPNDWFGYTVCIQGDYAIVGAYADDIGANTNQGSAYVFHFESNAWIQKQKLVAYDGSPEDYFGSSVSLYNNHVVIGTYSDDIGSNLAQGSAYIYQNINGIWMIYQRLLNPAGGSNHKFGFASSIYENRFIIGSPGVEEDRGMVIFGKINQ